MCCHQTRCVALSVVKSFPDHGIQQSVGFLNLACSALCTFEPTIEKVAEHINTEHSRTIGITSRLTPTSCSAATAYSDEGGSH